MTATARNTDQRTTGEPVTVDALKADLANLASTVQKLANDQLGNAAEAVQERTSETLTDLEQAIRKNPTQAAAIAAGAGFLIGLVLTR